MVNECGKAITFLNFSKQKTCGQFFLLSRKLCSLLIILLLLNCLVVVNCSDFTNLFPSVPPDSCIRFKTNKFLMKMGIFVSYFSIKTSFRSNFDFIVRTLVKQWDLISAHSSLKSTFHFIFFLNWIWSKQKLCINYLRILRKK